MTAYGIIIGLLLVTPWALVGVVVSGAALSAVARWRERRCTPVRLAKGGRYVRRPLHAISAQGRRRLSPGNLSLGGDQGPPATGGQIEERRAA